MNALHADDPRLAATLLQAPRILGEHSFQNGVPLAARERLAARVARQTRPRVLALHDLEGHPIAPIGEGVGAFAKRVGGGSLQACMEEGSGSRTAPLTSSRLFLLTEARLASTVAP